MIFYIALFFGLAAIITQLSRSRMKKDAYDSKMRQIQTRLRQLEEKEKREAEAEKNKESRG